MRGFFKRAAAFIAAGCVTATSVVCFAMPLFAFTKNMKSDSLHQVLDGSEVTNSDYYITYNITSAHEFSRLVWAETN